MSSLFVLLTEHFQVFKQTLAAHAELLYINTPELPTVFPLDQFMYLCLCSYTQR